MNMRPFNMELYMTCANADLCSKCPLRIGCPIRYTFYGGDFEVEIALQRAELLLQKQIGEQEAFTKTEWLRRKILCERGEHPGGYSYI